MHIKKKNKDWRKKKIKLKYNLEGFKLANVWGKIMHLKPSVKNCVGCHWLGTSQLKKKSPTYFGNNHITSLQLLTSNSFIGSVLRFHEWSFYPYNNPVRSVDPTLQIRKQKDAITCAACRWQNCDTNTHVSVYSVLHLVTQSCPTLSYLKDCCPQGSSVHGILQTRILVAMPFCRGSSWPRDWTWVSHIAGGIFTIWATREA